MAAIDVEVKGLREQLASLDQFPDDLRKGIEGVGREHMRSVAKGAGARVHRRTGATAKGYRVSITRKSWKIRNTTRGGAILEFAAVPKCPQGVALVSTLNQSYGRPGRILWAEFDQQRPEMDSDIARAVEAAEERANQGEVI